MEAVIFDGKEYVKASVLAARFRYTADYLGQLCRGKKVDARLVGRAWYINLDSLNEHRGGRYKNATKRPEVPVTEPKKVVEAPAPKPSNKSRYLSHIDVEPILKNKTVNLITEKKGVISSIPVRYETDDYSLIPRVNKQAVLKNLPVIPAEAEKVRVHKEESRITSFKAESLPEIYLKGRLTVDGLDEASEMMNLEEEKKEPEIKVSRIEEKPKFKPLLLRRLHKLPDASQPDLVPKSVPIGHNGPVKPILRAVDGDTGTVQNIPVLQRPVLQKAAGIAIQKSIQQAPLERHSTQQRAPLAQTAISKPVHQNTVIASNIKIFEVKPTPVSESLPLAKQQSQTPQPPLQTRLQSPPQPNRDIKSSKSLAVSPAVTFKPKTVLKTEAAKAEQKQQPSSMLLPLFSVFFALVISVLVLGVQEEILVGAGVMESSKFTFSLEEISSRF